MKKLTAGFSALTLCCVMLTGCGSSIPANTVHSIADLSGKKIGVQKGTTAEILAEDIENADTRAYVKAADGVQALEEGVIDAVIADLGTANTFLESHPDIMILNETYDEGEYAIAIGKDRADLQAEINSALLQLSVDGTLSTIKDNYEGDGQGQHPYTSKPDTDRSKGTLVMATNAEFPPFEWREGEKIVGFDVDMMQAVCDYLGYELQISDMAFDAVIPAVNKGMADVGVAALSVTEDRKELVLFSDVYETTHQVVIVRKK